MRAKLVWAPAPCSATSCTLGFSTLTSPHAHGDGRTVCRELGILIQSLGQVAIGERSGFANEEMGSCSYSSASVFIPVLPSLAATTAPWMQFKDTSLQKTFPHVSEKIREMSPALQPVPSPHCSRENNGMTTTMLHLCWHPHLSPSLLSSTGSFMELAAPAWPCMGLWAGPMPLPPSAWSLPLISSCQSVDLVAGTFSALGMLLLVTAILAGPGS